MCDPVTALIGAAVGGVALGSARAPRSGGQAPGPDPEIERAKTEAEAAQRANSQLAMDQRRRRGQASLMTRGATAAPQPTFGDGGNGELGLSPITTTARVTRSAVARQASSLMARGAPAVYGAGGAGGGRGTRGIIQ